MGKVINFEKDDTEKRLQGPVICLNCKHEWQVVAPLGEFDGFQCTNCGLYKGILEGLVHSREEIWHCDCGCHVFIIKKEGFLCMNCGVTQNF